MSISIMFEDDSVLFVDAVTNYTKSRRSRVSEHPVDQARVIADHVAKDNLSLSVKGVVSSADFHSEYARPSEYTDQYNYQVASEYNNPVDGVRIESGDSLLDLLPGSIRQFMTDDPEGQVTGDEFRGYSHESARDRLNRAWDASERLTILDYDFDIHNGRVINVRMFENCLINNLTDNEDPETGDAYYFTMQLKQVRLATIKEVEVNVSSNEVSDSAAKKDNMGNQTDGNTAGSSDGENEITREEALNNWNKKKREEAYSLIESATFNVSDVLPF